MGGVSTGDQEARHAGLERNAREGSWHLVVKVTGTAGKHMPAESDCRDNPERRLKGNV